jgi:hypothetical protein
VNLWELYLSEPLSVDSLSACAFYGRLPQPFAVALTLSSENNGPGAEMPDIDRLRDKSRSWIGITTANSRVRVFLFAEIRSLRSEWIFY